MVTSKQVVLVLMDLYSELGDNIALQYGGSEAHKKVSSSSGSGKQASCRNELDLSVCVFLCTDLLYLLSYSCVS